MSKIYRAILEISPVLTHMYTKTGDKISYVERLLKSENGSLYYEFGSINIVPKEPEGLNWIEVK